MHTTFYCHHCHLAHTRDEMILVTTRDGRRWRCKVSIRAAAKAKNDTRLKDEFGRKCTEANKSEAKLMRNLRSATENAEG